MFAYKVGLLVVIFQSVIVFVKYVFIAGVFIANMALLMILHMPYECLLIIESYSAKITERMVDRDCS